MAPLRIAMLTYSTHPRGGVIHAMELSEALHQLGHEICIFALDKGGQAFCRPLKCAWKLVPTQPAPAGTEMLIQQRIQDYVEFFREYPQPFEIYHAQDCISANALVRLRQEAPQSPMGKGWIVRTVHHLDPFTSPFLQECQRRSVMEVDHCFCVSREGQEQLLREYGRSSTQVWNGICRERFQDCDPQAVASLKQKYGLSGDPIYLTVGGIEPRKNSIRLLQAFHQVLSTDPQAQLVIAGGMTLFDYAAYREQFFATCEELQMRLGQSLILTGVVTDAELVALYHAADGFVFPSIQEGWGLVVMEAMAAGLPVLTSGIEPFTEFLTPDQALLVDPLEVSALSGAMRKLIVPEVAGSLISASQEVIRHYTWERSAQLQQQQYHTLQSRSHLREMHHA